MAVLGGTLHAHLGQGGLGFVKHVSQRHIAPHVVEKAGTTSAAGVVGGTDSLTTHARGQTHRVFDESGSTSTHQISGHAYSFDGNRQSTTENGAHAGIFRICQAGRGCAADGASDCPGQQVRTWST